MLQQGAVLDNRTPSLPRGTDNMNQMLREDEQKRNRVAELKLVLWGSEVVILIPSR